jgi:hypothetical protein
MKRREMIKWIAKEAKAQGVTFEFDYEGAKHSVYKLGGAMIPIPRHTELGEKATRDIRKETEEVLGKGWWR